MEPGELDVTFDALLLPDRVQPHRVIVGGARLVEQQQRFGEKARLLPGVSRVVTGDEVDDPSRRAAAGFDQADPVARFQLAEFPVMVDRLRHRGAGRAAPRDQVADRRQHLARPD
ncbi:hypothetical protein SDC9_190734 [bioreactor metagenome]|uniref:Uncharacterized protein n=1 Tax=bioreactor metagenome TaxID=1076179 RepID=A0A645HVU0_9ZZZZ